LNIPAEGKKLNPWETTENQNMVIESARAIGCQVVNIHASDLIHAADDHKEHLVLGLVWQVVKVQLLSQISIKEVPQLVRAQRRMLCATLYVTLLQSLTCSSGC
jgi:plastin-1